jgi:histidinol-phosphate aminotransferase
MSPTEEAAMLTRADLNALPEYVPGRTVPGAIKLASNEVPYGPLPGVADAIAEAAGSTHRYPDMAVVALREALAERLGVAPDRVATGCGSVALAEHLVGATCHEGDEVLFSWRSFEAYPIIAATAAATAVRVPNRADHGHDLDAMAAAITDRTRLVLVCNPNNPTGTSLRRDELAAFLDAVPGTCWSCWTRRTGSSSPTPTCPTAWTRSGTGRTWSCCARCPRRGAWPGCGSATWRRSRPWPGPSAR